MSIKHNIPSRYLKLLSTAQPVVDRTGLLGQNAIRGIFAKEGVITSMNGRMLIQLKIEHDLPDGMYTLQRNVLKQSRYNMAIYPTQFGGMPESFDHMHIVGGVPWPGKISLFALCMGIPLDLGDTSKPLDVLCRQFKTWNYFFYANKLTNSPILIHGLCGSDSLKIYCVPYVLENIQVTSGEFTVPYNDA